MTKTTTLEVYQLTALSTDPATVRTYLRPVAGTPQASGGGQDVLDFALGTEPTIGARYTADTTYTEVVS
ncbi:MAG TPA: hypothetical protein VFI96_08965 [Longimicrobiaceae bacterium]|nr:hypothetical protein [Longimicrobiaceae bacterium]